MDWFHLWICAKHKWQFLLDYTSPGSQYLDAHRLVSAGSQGLMKTTQLEEYKKMSQEPRLSAQGESHLWPSGRAGEPRVETRARQRKPSLHIAASEAQR